MGFSTSFGLVNLSISFNDDMSIVDKNYIENSLRLKIKDMDELYKQIKTLKHDTSDIFYD